MSFCSTHQWFRTHGFSLFYFIHVMTMSSDVSNEKQKADGQAWRDAAPEVDHVLGLRVLDP
jgi:hypothetical protein